ncbi:MAG: hypothetical protein ACK2TX_00490 [Anaerolineales bacterium]
MSAILHGAMLKAYSTCRVDPSPLRRAGRSRLGPGLTTAPMHRPPTVSSLTAYTLEVSCGE